MVAARCGYCRLLTLLLAQNALPGILRLGASGELQRSAMKELKPRVEVIAQRMHASFAIDIDFTFVP